MRDKPTVFLSWTLFSLSGIAPAVGPAGGTHRFAMDFFYYVRS